MKVMDNVALPLTYNKHVNRKQYQEKGSRRAQHSGAWKAF